ncbi:MAG: hypothetical protein HN413_05420 [Chloroflexi bacterium]|jgi:hypothetical protein|nr:hypothetical protein [Chloroflexota bacterium]
MKPNPVIVLIAFLAGVLFVSSAFAQSENPNPPPEPVKLIFIHHSVGENWLTDGYGNLGRTLAENNYFVSDTNYGWGSDSIGDATDYHNWYDWFLGPESSRYLQAVHAESGQNSDYTRLFADPGGENQIILFKSCFPNSDLSGSPNDTPAEGEWFTVGHAKYVYIQLLDYFITRPDKLFIAITPPPLLDSSNAINAREFSRWLVEDWLNEYPLNNVAVWDLHNTLTHRDNHHRFFSGAVEHAVDYGSGILYYDSDGDEHPNASGSQKATDEFVPMLNIFYNRWIANAPTAPAPEQEAQTQPEAGEANSEQGVPLSDPGWVFGVGALVDDFESGPPPGTEGWQAFWDDATPITTLSCGIDSSLAQAGSASLRINFHIEPDSWGTCALMYDSAPGFGNSSGIAFDYRASEAALLFNLDAYGGNPEARATYHYVIETVPESVDGWVHVELTWDQIVRVDWEENAGQAINPAEINGFAIGFSTYSDVPNSGTVWVDNLEIFEANQTPEETESTSSVVEEAAAPPAETEPPAGGVRSLCPASSGLVGLGFLGILFLKRKNWC